MSRLNLPSAPVKKQQENKSFWNKDRSEGAADFFTVGYAGRKTDEIIDCLKKRGICTLIDIRQNAVSMYRPDLSKSNFAALLSKNSIAYEHLPKLGVPRDIRAKAIETGTRDIIWSWYDDHVIPSFFGRNLHFFLNAFEHPVALMCTEIDPHECHRHRLALALEQMGMRGFDL